ncbi:hypothetical protein M0804_004596 [Polistes exclamans]|nr:hypothetical protein M0804_004596 [Polistes exclamans]
MVPRGLSIERSTWEQPEPEQQRFYDSPPPRMDVSVCCLPASAGSGAQHSHPASLPSGGQSTIQAPYQYADQIVPDRGQPDGLAVLGCTGQNNWQQISNSSTVAAGVTATTTAYIDYSWLQMQASQSIYAINSKIAKNHQRLKYLLKTINGISYLYINAFQVVR